MPRTAGVTELQPGYQIVIPNLPPLDRGPTGTIHEDVLSGLRVQTGDGVRLEHSPVGIMLSGTGPGDGLADIGGARVLVVEGFQLHLARVARPLPTAASPPEGEPPVTQPPPAEVKPLAPPEPEGPPTPGEGDAPPGGAPPARETSAPEGPPLPGLESSPERQSPLDEGPPIEDNDTQPSGPPAPEGRGHG
ncbi:MAG: hypothetical protein U1E76_10290 [Planctomycetota bacterium]